VVSGDNMAGTLTLVSGATLQVASGAELGNFAVSKGNTVELLSSGSVSGISVLSGGTFVYEGGGTALGNFSSGGSGAGSGGGGILVSSGGTMVFDDVDFALYGTAGPDVAARPGTVFEIVSGTVLSGGTDNTLTSGTGIIGAGGTAIGVPILAGGFAEVESGGTAEDSIISSGGKAIIFFSGYDSGTTISSGGTEIVSSGGTAVDPTVAVSGTLTVSSGGIVEVQSGATVFGKLVDSGTVIASAGVLEIGSHGVVSGGAVQIADGLVIVDSGGSANVVFVATDSGGLQIADSAGQTSAFTGTVSGFGGTSHTNSSQYIDLTSVTSAGTITVSYTSASGNKSGTLDVLSNSTLVAAIKLIGSYSAGDFHVTAGQGGTVEITDPTTVAQGGSVQSANLALFGSYIAGSFVTAAGGAGGSSASPTSDSQPPLLTHPHA